jgi:hypothetical protein
MQLDARGKIDLFEAMEMLREESFCKTGIAGGCYDASNHVEDLGIIDRSKKIRAKVGGLMRRDRLLFLFGRSYSADNI